jgi:4-diphosphocytidyl-2-C-methyl-D-erythritol kinase
VVRVLAPAKINLSLEVIRRRDDGYHDLDTVMTTLDLADRVTLSQHEDGQTIEVELTGGYARGIDLTDDLAGRAARALAAEAGVGRGVRIAVEKRIPSPGGLGGGSSDAAAVLRGLNVLWGLGWPAERLAEVGASVGSDVPFFVHGGTARCTGRGEFVEPLRDLTSLRVLILLPPVPARPDKTARRFAALRAGDFSDGHRSERLARRIDRGAPPPARDLRNAFEGVVQRTESELLAHYAAYEAAGAPQLHLCGAGPAVYLLVHENAKASELRRDYEAAGAEVFDARSLPRAAATAIERGDGEP